MNARPPNKVVPGNRQKVRSSGMNDAPQRAIQATWSTFPQPMRSLPPEVLEPVRGQCRIDRRRRDRPVP
jgi:hypothetical protein